jgi:hypothetical protein
MLNQIKKSIKNAEEKLVLEKTSGLQKKKKKTELNVTANAKW